MNSLPRTSGIYMITCTVNRKIYIGSAANLRQRWNRHRSELATQKHPNRHLQSAWNKYGADSFTFEILELVMPWSLLDREQYWLDKLNPFDSSTGFNMAVASDSPMRGRRATDETREKLRNIHLGKPKSSESRQKLSAARKGMKLSDQTRARIKRSKQHEFIITTPDGINMNVRGLKEFCANNQLSYTTMIKVAGGLQESHKGWKCRHA